MRKPLTAILFFLCLAAFATTAYSAESGAGLILGGSDKSPVKLEVFSDFECPACGFFFLNAIPQILENFKDRVCVIYYEFPLPQHPYARPAARYVNAAARLGDREKLVAVFKTLFTDQDEWAKTGNLDASISKALSPEDLEKVKGIMETERIDIEQEIDSDIQIGEKRAVYVTPTIIITHGDKEERVSMPSNIRNIYSLLSGRLNGLLK